MTQEEREERFKSLSGLFTLYHTFETFMTRPGTKKMLVAVKALAEDNPQRPFLLIYGGTGNGKTHLIEAFIIARGRQGQLVRYWTVAEVMDKLKSAINAEWGRPGLEETTMMFAKSNALVLDDWGTEYGTDFEASRLEQIIDSRYRARLVTLMASNKDWQDLDKRHPRIISRFSDPDIGQIVWNEATDYRKVKRG